MQNTRPSRSGSRGAGLRESLGNLFNRERSSSRAPVPIVDQASFSTQLVNQTLSEQNPQTFQPQQTNYSSNSSFSGLGGGGNGGGVLVSEPRQMGSIAEIPPADSLVL